MIHLPDINIILASKSPRRQDLLSQLGLQFEIRTKETEEVYPDHLVREEVAVYLAELKARAFESELQDNDLLITSDTIVCVDDAILNKPKDREEAVRMLQLLSNRTHEVITGVCLMHKGKLNTFFSETAVYFKALETEEIDYYIDTYKPYDKAGAYGIQEWIGFIGIDKIEGSYFNVMGLPVKRLYEELRKY